MANSTSPKPIINPNNPFQWWHISAIYNPDNPTSGSVYVPNPLDAIMDWDNGIFKVTDVDYTTGKSLWEAWTLPKQPDQINDDDILLGAGPGTIADSYRAYVDYSVVPAVLSIETRQRVYGSTVASYKLFLGTDAGPTGRVVSKYYDQNGTLLGENIPFELVAMPDGATNRAVKRPLPGSTTDQLVDGELLMMVTYDDVGGVVSKAKFVVENTQQLRRASASAKYVTAIALKTPWLSPADASVVEFPVNMPVLNLDMFGEVTYSDGSKIVLPVDGIRFRLEGLTNYVATQVGQTVPLMLIYALAPNEFTYDKMATPNNNITKRYTARTLESDGAYSIKLFGYPTWTGAITGYSMRYYLYNLDRQDVYDVTSKVQNATAGSAFDPTLYNTVQWVGVAVNMDQVDPLYSPYRHTQLLGITLLRQGTDQSGDNWTVAFSPGQNPVYGLGVKAVATFINANNWTLDISCGTTTVDDFLAKVYYPAQPLFDTYSEDKAPVPNIMRLIINGAQVDFPVSRFKDTLTIGQTLTEGSLVTIQWILRDSGNDLQLGCSALIIHQVPTA